MLLCSRLGSVAAAGLSLLAFGCTETSGPRTWVGRARASEEAVAIVEEAGAVLAYTCGGATTFHTHSRWFTGTAGEAGAVELTEEDWVFSASLNDGASEATAKGPGGEEVVFDVRPTDGEDEGVYETTDSGCRTGVVLQADPDGATRVQGTWCDSQENAAQVTPVSPVEVQSGRLHVRVDLSFLGEGLRDLYVLRVQEP